MKKNNSKINKVTLFGFTLSLFLLFSSQVFSQKTADYKDILGQETHNAITPAVPFMMIAPDSRSSAMGDVGVALSPDAMAEYWNSSKLAFVKNKMGMALGYTPWLKNLVNDIILSYLTGYYKIDKNQAVGIGLRYFSMGNVTFTNSSNEVIGSFSPHEFAIDASYNRKLGKHFSLGIAPRFILSNLTNGQSASGETSQSGKSVAVDINGYYTNSLKVLGKEADWALGFNVSNIGSKLSYTETEKNFIPTNLRLGGAFTLNIDDYNSITAAIDLNKLLVPTPPFYVTDSVTGKRVVAAGKDPNVGIITGMFQSFYDAPGIGNKSKFAEELSEINYSVGVEYWYAKQFAVRAGYFYEAASKGNRKYFTAGVGLRLNVFGLDFSYLVPAAGKNSPLEGTWRVSLLFNMNGE